MIDRPMQRIFWSLLVLLMLGGCVPNRNYVYLQKNDVNKKGLPKDTVVRTYPMVIEEYKIQPLDILSIRMESLTADEFDFISKLNPTPQGGGNMAMGLALSGFLVDNDGNVEFPVVGQVKLAELTLFEAQEKMREVFKPFLKNPVARVRLLNFRFTILGEVSGEQQVISPNTRVTMSEAIGMAGGLTDMADRKNVKVIRQKGNTAEVFYLNLLEEELLSASHYYVQQNDIIVVPALRQRPFRRYWGQNIGLFVSTVSVVLLTINLFK
jgi:polysaccharide export outer membrane protein